jgi:signal transduction protein with GAF and PtsI domain
VLIFILYNAAATIKGKDRMTKIFNQAYIQERQHQLNHLPQRTLELQAARQAYLQKIEEHKAIIAAKEHS